jgi:hypothetical protein
MRRHRHQEFIRFLNAVERPRRRESSTDIVDNYEMARTSSAMDVPFRTDIGFLAQCGRGLLCNPHKRRLHHPSLEFRRDGGRKNPLLKIEIGGEHYDVANCHAAWPCQHEHHHCCHFAGLQQTSGLLGLLQLLRRPIREQCADDGAG